LKDFNASKYSAEEAVRGAGLKYYAIFRPPWLVHNYASLPNALHFPDLREVGELRTAIRVDLPIAHLDAYDVGRFAAAALLNPAPFASKEITLAAGNYTIKDAGRELEVVTGSKIPVVQLDPADLIKDQGHFMNHIRGIIAIWTNEKGMAITEEQLVLQNSFGIEPTTIRAAFERIKDELPFVTV